MSKDLHNKDTGYSNVLQRIKEELYEEPNQEGIILLV